MSAIYKNFNTNNGTEVERIFNMQFKDCAMYIGKMDTMRKAQVAAEIRPIIDSLYMQADRYGNSDYPLEDQIGPDMFIHIMSKIKRWETVLYWLYEIDILMGETELDRMVATAEKKLEAIDWDLDAVKTVVVPNTEGIVGKSGKVTKTVKRTVNLYQEYKELKYKQIDRGNHTEEIIQQSDIMAQAAALAKRYFK